MPDDQERERIELVPEAMKIKSGEVLYGDGRASPVIWIEAEGRRLHADSEALVVFLFLSPEDAEDHAVRIIKEVAVLDLSVNLPIGPSDG